MSTEQHYHNRPGNGKIFAGLILLAVGGVLLLQQLSWFIFPDWLISWPMFLIAWGFYTGVKHNFRKPIWFVLIIIGTIFLFDDVFPAADLHRIFWPLLIISFGIWMILGRRCRDRSKYENQWHNRFSNLHVNNPFDPNGNPVNASPDPNAPQVSAAHSADDYLDTVSVFSGVKKTILSKNFKGGEVVNVFGGTEIDLTMADINGRVTIDVTQIFGGIKMIVPPHWMVVSEVASVFAGTDDKRRMGVPLSPDKILVLKGTSIFAGIDIRSF